MSRPVGTRMTDEEFSRHQSSPQWAKRARAGQRWLAAGKKKIAAKHDRAVQAAQKRFYAALAKAGNARDIALVDLEYKEHERVNADIRAVAIELGIWS